MELLGGLVRVDEREDLHVRVPHLAGRVEVAKVVHGVEGTHDVVADEPVASENGQ